MLAASLVCSGSPIGEAIRRGEAEIFVPTELQVTARPSVIDSRSCSRRSTGSYAVPLPSIQNNRYTCPRLFDAADIVPILADAPNLNVAGIESPNHYGGLVRDVFRTAP